MLAKPRGPISEIIAKLEQNIAVETASRNWPLDQAQCIEKADS